MRLLYRLMLWTAALCLLLIIALCLWAGDQLASPTRRPLQDYHREFLADPAAHGVSVESLTLSDATPCLMVQPRADGKLGTRGLKLRDQFKTETIALPTAGQVIGTLVLVHGRKGRKEDYLLIAERLCAVGFRCILPDMPAHGEHPEAYATFGIREADIPARALQESAEKFKFNPVPAGLMGMSMGGAVSMHAAARPDQPWQALVILSSFDRLETAIQKNVSDRVGCFLGNAWAGIAGWIYQWKTGIAIQEIRSDLPAAKITIPTLVAHGTSDRVIPQESGKRLYMALPETIEKQWIDVPEADHDNVLITDFPIYATVAEWMLRHVTSTP